MPTYKLIIRRSISPPTTRPKLWNEALLKPMAPATPKFPTHSVVSMALSSGRVHPLERVETTKEVEPKILASRPIVLTPSPFFEPKVLVKTRSRPEIIQASHCKDQPKGTDSSIGSVVTQVAPRVWPLNKRTKFVPLFSSPPNMHLSAPQDAPFVYPLGRSSAPNKHLFSPQDTPRVCPLGRPNVLNMPLSAPQDAPRVRPVGLQNAQKLRSSAPHDAPQVCPLGRTATKKISSSKKGTLRVCPNGRTSSNMRPFALQDAPCVHSLSWTASNIRSPDKSDAPCVCPQDRKNTPITHMSSGQDARSLDSHGVRPKIFPSSNE